MNVNVSVSDQQLSGVTGVSIAYEVIPDESGSRNNRRPGALRVAISRTITSAEAFSLIVYEGCLADSSRLVPVTIDLLTPAGVEAYKLELNSAYISSVSLNHHDEGDTAEEIVIYSADSKLSSSEDNAGKSFTLKDLFADLEDE